MPQYTPAQEPNYFGQLLAILTTRELSNLKLRCLTSDPRLAEILDDEVQERRAIEAHKAHDPTK